MSDEPGEYRPLIVFSGKMDANIRCCIRAKRLQLGLSYQKMAAFFEIDWSTVRKWEQGPTNTCNALWQSKLEHFLNGDYDHLLLSPRAAVSQHQKKRLPASAQRCQALLEHTYALLHDYPELQIELLQNVTRASQDLLIRLAEKIAQVEAKHQVKTSRCGW